LLEAAGDAAVEKLEVGVRRKELKPLLRRPGDADMAV
jgi:hypothetical protein